TDRERDGGHRDSREPWAVAKQANGVTKVVKWAHTGNARRVELISYLCLSASLNVGCSREQFNLSRSYGAAKCGKLPRERLAGLSDDQSFRLGGSVERLARMQKDAKRPLHDPQDEIQHATTDSYQHLVTWIAEKEHAIGEASRHSGAAHAVGRTAHDTIEDDDVSMRNGFGTLENVHDTKRAPIFNAFVSGELLSVRFVCRHQFDDLSAIRA